MSKAKGARNERKARRVLEAAGYHCLKAGGSLGLFDLIAVSRIGVRLVQVKSNRDASPLEREAIAEFDNLPANASKEIWVYHDYARQPSIKVYG